MREFHRPRVWLVLLALPLLWPGWLLAAAKQQIYDLPLPRTANPGEMLVARISVGPLKAHQRIIVRIRNGKIAGTVSPFGAHARQGTGVYTIPLPVGAVRDGQVRLLLELVEKDAPARAPTADEVREVTLAYIPVTGYREKDQTGRSARAMMAGCCQGSQEITRRQPADLRDGIESRLSNQAASF